MFASVCTPCFMVLSVFQSCCTKFETSKTFEPTNSNISFVPWSPKRSATLLDPFARLFQHCWGHARALHMAILLGDHSRLLQYCRSNSFKLSILSHNVLQVPTLFLALNSILPCLGLNSKDITIFYFFSECSCPKGNPSAVPPIYAQKCDLVGSCYCTDLLVLTDSGCILRRKYKYILG